MAAPATTTDFLGLVQKSGLLDAQALARAADELELPIEPFACAEALVRARLLTPFQAKQILAGRYRGLVLGPYRILRPLGKGGVGIVYLADHTSLDRKVAIKVLSQEQAQEKLALERFQREARAVAALDHPNIVRLHDITQVGGVHFLVMEYVDGTDLHTLLQQTGRMHYAQAASYIAQAAAGLGHAHEKGFVHRDVKPANLMLTKDGAVKVLDLGLARSVLNPNDELTGKLADDHITGTVDFISPEQALNVHLDARSDIYSLGATFFTLVAGRPPFEGSTAQKLTQHQLASAPNTRKVRSDVPPELDAVIARMMAKKPRDRYQTAAEVIDALAPWVKTTSSESKPTAAAKKKKRKLKAAREEKATRRIRLYVGGGVLAGLLFAGVFVALLSGKSKPTNSSANNPAGAQVPVPPASDSRALGGHAQFVNDVVITPDGTRFASVDWGGKVLIWDAKTNQKLYELQTRVGASCRSCATTADGRFLLVSGDRMPVLVYNWANGQEVREYAPHAGTTWGLAPSPTGQNLLTTGSDGVVLLRNLATGEEVRRLDFGGTLVWTAVFSPDGTKFAIGTSRSNSPDQANVIKVYATADGKELHHLAGHTRDVRYLSFRPDGQVLASSGFDGTVRLWNLTTGTEVRTITAHDGYAERVHFLPGGRRLLTCGGPMGNGQPGFEGGAVKVWDAETGKELKGWRGADATGFVCLFPSRDGQFAVGGNRERTVRVWSLPPAP